MRALRASGQCPPPAALVRHWTFGEARIRGPQQRRGLGARPLARGRSPETPQASGQCNPPAASARHWPRGTPRKHRPFCTTNHNQMVRPFCLSLDSVYTKVSRPESRVRAKSHFPDFCRGLPARYATATMSSIPRGRVGHRRTAAFLLGWFLRALQWDAWSGEFLRGPIGCVATSNERTPSSGKKAPGTRSVRAKE